MPLAACWPCLSVACQVGPESREFSEGVDHFHEVGAGLLDELIGGRAAKERLAVQAPGGEFDMGFQVGHELANFGPLPGVGGQERGLGLKIFEVFDDHLGLR